MCKAIRLENIISWIVVAVDYVQIADVCAPNLVDLLIC